MFLFWEDFSNYTRSTVNDHEKNPRSEKSWRLPPVTLCLSRQYQQLCLERRAVAKGGVLGPSDLKIWHGKCMKIPMFNIKNHRKVYSQKYRHGGYWLEVKFIQVLLKHDALRLAAGPLVSQRITKCKQMCRNACSNSTVFAKLRPGLSYKFRIAKSGLFGPSEYVRMPSFSPAVWTSNVDTSTSMVKVNGVASLRMPLQDWFCLERCQCFGGRLSAHTFGVLEISQGIFTICPVFI